MSLDESIFSVSHHKYLASKIQSFIYFSYCLLSLCRVLLFEDKANGSPCKPDGPPPKRDIASLP